MDDFNFFNLIFNCILILKNQMRAIQKLAISAEEFGKGKEIKFLNQLVRWKLDRQEMHF